MALQLKITLDGVNATRLTIEKFAKFGPKAMNRASGKMATYCARHARKYLKGPYSTGRTRVMKRGAKGQYYVVATHRASKTDPEGTRALMSIEEGAKKHMIGHIQHPGMKGKYFMSKAFDDTVSKANRIIGQALREFKL